MAALHKFAFADLLVAASPPFFKNYSFLVAGDGTAELQGRSGVKEL